MRSFIVAWGLAACLALAGHAGRADEAAPADEANDPVRRIYTRILTPFLDDARRGEARAAWQKRYDAWGAANPALKAQLEASAKDRE